jgi:hypothetical protein
VTSSILPMTNRPVHLCRGRRTYLWLMLTTCLALGTARAAGEEPADPNNAAAQVELIARMTAENQASKAEAVLWAEQ